MKNRQTARDAVLDAAEHLLRRGTSAEFSMRELAREAGVSFRTPFNHFGSKNAVMQALSARVIERMAVRFKENAPAGDAIDRVLAMGRISAAVLLEQPEVYKVVVGSLGVVTAVPSTVRVHSQHLWSITLGDFAGISAEASEIVRVALPEQLAFVFRGCLSFWIAGELQDSHLESAFRTGACLMLLGVARKNRRSHLLAQMKSVE
jgi:AcrR family transcriptional regulator